MKKRRRTGKVFKNAPGAAATGTGMAKSACLGTAVSALLWILLLILCACVLKSNADPGKLFAPVGFACAAVSSLAGGFASGKLGKNASLGTGALCGTVFLAVLFAVSLVFPSSEHGIVYRSALCLCVIAAAVIGVRMSAAGSGSKRHRGR